VQRRERQTSYLRETGRPVQVDPAPAIAHVRSLHSRGMTCAQMAAHSRLSKNTFQDLARGARTRDRGYQPIKVIDRPDLEEVLRVEFRAPDSYGAHVDGVGTRRRVRALYAVGYGGRFLAGQLGVALQRVHGLLRSEGKVTASTRSRVIELYDKYHAVDPADMGLSAYSISRALGDARRARYAPPGCWDYDTIDDPQAIPQWTGACGTWIGARAHRREGIEMCPACKPHDLGVKVPGFSREKVRALRERSGLSRVALGKLVGVDASTIQYWEDGRSTPERQWRIDKLLSVLDATFEDVTDEEG